jgi:hypothetical protein
MRIESGLVDWLKGEVGEVRSAANLSRICGGKVVVLGGQRVLSLSRTRARIVGDFVAAAGAAFSPGLLVVGGCLWRCGPRFSGRCVKVGIVRWGRNWEGFRRRVCTAWLKPRRLVLGVLAILLMLLYVYGDEVEEVSGLWSQFNEWLGR